MFKIHIGLAQPADYEIRIQGRLDGTVGRNDSLGGWFQGEVECKYETGEAGEAITVLSGAVADQAALHGLLNYIRDLNLTLLYLDCLSAHASESKTADARFE